MQTYKCPLYDKCSEQEYFFEVGISCSKTFCVICFIESPLKMMKNAFFSYYKLFWISRYLSFYHDFGSCVKNGLIRKISLFSKSMTSQTGKQTNAIHILLNISRSKGNQLMNLVN